MYFKSKPRIQGNFLPNVKTVRFYFGYLEINKHTNLSYKIDVLLGKINLLAVK